MSIQQFCLRWNNHQPNFISVFTTMLNNEFLVDVTLSAEGKELHAHKIILSACSVYFQTLFATYPKKHAIVIIKDIKYTDLRVIVDFMYYGEINVSEEQLPGVLETAQLLKIKGLTEMPDSSLVAKTHNNLAERSMPERTLPERPLPERTLPERTMPERALPERTEMPFVSPGGDFCSDGHRQSVSPCRVGNIQRKRSLIPDRPDPDPASIENSAQKSSNENHLVSNQDMKLMLSYNQNQNIKHEYQKGLDEGGSIENNIEEDRNNYNMNKPPDLNNIEESSAAHMQLQDHQWPTLDEQGYQRYSNFICQNINIENNMDSGNLEDMHGQEGDITPNVPPILNPCEYQNEISSQQNMHKMDMCSPGPSCNNLPNVLFDPNAPLKRRRRSNPQSEENFQRALEAVRFGGIGFCKAARMFGVNNRTLWLEYKKKGYPNNRLSITNRIKLEHRSPPPDPMREHERPILPQDQQLPILCPPHTVGMMGFLEPVDFTSNMQNINRARFGDEPNIMANSPINLNLHGLNFNVM